LTHVLIGEQSSPPVTIGRAGELELPHDVAKAVLKAEVGSRNLANA
jgi:hypothetical protein